MKRFLSFFYTNSFKGLLLILILLFTFLSSEYTLKTALLYKEDPVALFNVFKQRGNFDFESSIYLSNGVETATREVLCFSLSSKKNSNEYLEASKKIDSYKNFSFAVVNHTTNKITSNIPRLNGKSASLEIRNSFPDNAKSLMIVYNSKSPYFESGTAVDYVSIVSRLSKDYNDIFDIYIYFGEGFSFLDDIKNFEERDASMFNKVNNTLTFALIFLVTSFVLFVVLFLLTGKKEFGGRQYLSTFDKIPNDLLFSLYLLILFCSTSLYSNSIHMLIKTTYYESYWFNFTPDFYILRGNICSVVFSLSFMLLSFSLKRQYKNKSLLKNTHIYNLISSYKAIKSK